MSACWWDEGRRSGRQVATLSGLACITAAAINLALTGMLSLFFDLTFVVVCLVAAFAVRPRDFFAVGVLPPMLMFGTVTVLAVVARPAVADPVDGVVQAVVSGLAHHAGGLVAGYSLTLVVLALRQVALRSADRTRSYA